MRGALGLHASATEYVKLQATASVGAIDLSWGTRQVYWPLEMVESHGRRLGLTVEEYMDRDGYDLLPSGWWKHRREAKWVRVKRTGIAWGEMVPATKADG